MGGLPVLEIEKYKSILAKHGINISSEEISIGLSSHDEKIKPATSEFKKSRQLGPLTEFRDNTTKKIKIINPPKSRNPLLHDLSKIGINGYNLYCHLLDRGIIPVK